jgi:predicted transcriptional regulator
MTSQAIPVSPATRVILFELANQTGRPVAELLDTAVIALQQELTAKTPITSIPGVNPADVWEAAAEVEAGRLTSHTEVFARLRNRS